MPRFTRMLGAATPMISTVMATESALAPRG